jgi:hypothetical protein
VAPLGGSLDGPKRPDQSNSEKKQQIRAGPDQTDIGVRQTGMGPIQTARVESPRAATANRTYPLAGTAEGLRRVEQGHARGKVVITVAQDRRARPEPADVLARRSAAAA